MPNWKEEGKNEFFSSGALRGFLQVPVDEDLAEVAMDFVRARGERFNEGRTSQRTSGSGPRRRRPTGMDVRGGRMGLQVPRAERTH